MLREIRYALRQLLRAPGFTAAAVLTLAVGIGATTAIFTLVYDVLLRPLPYAHPDRLVEVREQVAEFRDIYPQLPLSANHFANWERNSRTIESMAAMIEESMPLGANDHPLQVRVLKATPGIFAVLDAQPWLGRAFSPDEAKPGHEREIVLMYDLWRTQFQGDRGILGRTISLNGFPFTVIGVMPESFRLPSTNGLAIRDASRTLPVEALVPLAFTAEQLSEAMGDFNYFGLARLKPGVSAAQANADLDALQHAISAALPADEKGTLSTVVMPLQQALIGNNRKPLLILLVAVAGLLLVGCVNIANLLLARAAGRRQQMAIAAALGASRAEMLRASLLETTLLAGLGGALGTLAAALLVPAMYQYLPPALRFRSALHLDWTGTGCAVILALLATLFAGAVPAWIASRTHPHEVLNSESRLASESRNSKRLRRALVAVEVAVSVALVLTTGLLTASLVQLLHVNHGFETDHVVTATVNMPSGRFAEMQPRIGFYRDVLERLRHLPGVQAAGATSVLPLAGDQWIDMIRASGDTRPFMQLPTEHFRWISPGYLEAVGLPLVAGRSLSASDQGKNYALVSERTARTLWPGKDVVGRQFTRGDNTQPPFTVIGVVRDARTISLAQPDPMMIYVPYWYRCNISGGLLVRTRQDPSAMAGAIRKAVWSVSADVSVPEVRALGGILADSVATRRFEMDLLLLFAVSALMLAGLGVYGVVAYSLAQRQREIGLRFALGARRARIYSLVLRDGLQPVLAGAAIGIGVAFAFARLLSSLLFQVSPLNPLIAAGAVSVLLAVGTAACLLPARRAAAVEPMQALRNE